MTDARHVLHRRGRSTYDIGKSMFSVFRAAPQKWHLRASTAYVHEPRVGLTAQQWLIDHELSNVAFSTRTEAVRALLAVAESNSTDLGVPNCVSEVTLTRVSAGRYRSSNGYTVTRQFSPTGWSLSDRDVPFAVVPTLSAAISRLAERAATAALS